jgi:hypothetical protein
MTSSSAVVRLRAAARALLSRLFGDHDPTPQAEALESELAKIEASLGRLKTVVLHGHHDGFDWGDFLEDMLSILDQLRAALENEDGAQCVMRIGRTLPVYTRLFDAALAAVRYASSVSLTIWHQFLCRSLDDSNHSQPRAAAPDTVTSPFESLGQAIEAFQKGSTIPATNSTRQFITNSDVLDFETQSEYGPLIWQRLCADTRLAVKNGLVPGKRLFLAASWICAVSIPGSASN